MIPRIRLLLWLCLSVMPLWPQTPVESINPCIQQACFFAVQNATVGASSSVTLTVQQPSTGARQVVFNSAIVQCPGQSFTVDQSQNGTAAAATAGTAVTLVPVKVTGAGATVTAAATVWTSSNVGPGTATGPTLTYSSGSVAVIDLSQRTIGLSGTANNYSIKLTNSGSGSCSGSVAVYWAEKI